VGKGKGKRRKISLEMIDSNRRKIIGKRIAEVPAHSGGKKCACKNPTWTSGFGGEKEGGERPHVHMARRLVARREGGKTGNSGGVQLF